MGEKNGGCEAGREGEDMGGALTAKQQRMHITKIIRMKPQIEKNHTGLIP